VAATGAKPAASFFPQPSLREKLATRAEASAYVEASSYDDVRSFLAALDARAAPIVLGSLATTTQQRQVPYVIASRPLVRNVAEARALRRPIVYIQAGIHGDEVDGTEALLAMLRDFCLSSQKTLLEELVLVIAPLYNPDGRENTGPLEQRRPYQNGPALVGDRRNGQGLDLDLDYVKLEAPETLGAVALLDVWKPDVVLDVRTGGVSCDVFAALLGPALHPAAFGGSFARTHLLPDVARKLREKFALDSFSYGHFGRDRELAVPPPAGDAANYGWFAYDYKPRFALNYLGLRGAVSALAAVNARDTFEQRIFSSRAFVEAALSFCAENDEAVLDTARRAAGWSGGYVCLQAAYPAGAVSQPFEWEDVLANGGATLSRGMLPVHDRYAAARFVLAPKAHLVPSGHAQLTEPLLRAHGITYETLSESRTLRAKEFHIDSLSEAATLEGHLLRNIQGEWLPARIHACEAGSLLIPTAQPLGPLLSVLLEPESDDGFYVWNAFDAVLQPNAPAPLLSVV